MKFDYYILNSYVPELDGDGPELHRKWFEQVELAEELGFHCAWFTEHHFGFYGGMLPNPQLLMAALAQRTKRIRLGTSVTLLPLHNPLSVAEDMAVLDIVSEGRIEVGIGRGMNQIRFDLFGADRQTAQERVDEYADILRHAWTEDNFCWDGKYLQCPTPITVRPRPVQKPHPPIWMAVSHDPAHARVVGRQGFNLMTIPWHPPDFGIPRQIVAEYRAGLADTGHDRGTREILAMYYTYVGETAERAQIEVGESWLRHHDIAVADRGTPDATPFSYEGYAAGSRAIFGDPDMCRRHVRRIHEELGVDRIALLCHFGGLPQDRVLASMRLFANEVAPAFD